MKKTLYIVHNIDTEGPLEETIPATFKRIKENFNIKLKPSITNLRRLQNKELNLNGIENKVAEFVATKRLNYLSNWIEVEKMIKEITSKEFRFKYRDMLGNPYTFSWFIIDNVGYKDNPRKRAIGYHSVWDKYQDFLKGQFFNDCLGWHFHTVPVGNHALHYNTCWTNNDYHEQVLARRIIQRNWFPSIFRAGANIERNDVNFWLEQFIPFDYSLGSVEGNAGSPGEIWDWRGCSNNWGYYHPSFYDFRKKGDMNRSLFRCLEVDTTFSVLNEYEVEKAFKQVRKSESTILAYSSHDRRDIKPDIFQAYDLIKKVSKKYKDVKWKFENAHNAALKVLKIKSKKVPNFKIEQKNNLLIIESDQKLFGPLPFLAIEEKGEVFYRDNPTIENQKKWAYILTRPENTLKVGVAGANKSGFVGLKTINIK